MEWVEVTGRTLQEAREMALDQLGVDEHDAEFEVLEEPRPGLFGRLRSQARVRARVLPTAPRPKLERRDRRRPRGERSGVSGSGRSQRDGADGPSRGGAASPEAGPVQADAASGHQARESAAGAEAAPMEDQLVAAEEFLRGLVASFELDASVSAHPVDPETIEAQLHGEGLGVLIGPRGETLSALQELTRVAVQRRLGSRSARLLVDVADYRRKRSAALERFARKEAEKVRESGVARELEPMLAPDRKVVHDTVNLIDGVESTSEGEEPQRRVVIMPARGQGASAPPPSAT